MKEFDHWNKLKKNIEKTKKEEIVYFKEREIWWCSIGINIGHEEDGKNSPFERPVLVIKKFNFHIFFGIPLSAQEKENKYYIPLTYPHGEGQAMISQMRLFSSKRMTRKIAMLDKDEFFTIINEFKKILPDETPLG